MNERKTSNLRKARIDRPHARYFITFCCSRPADITLYPDITQKINDILEDMHAKGDFGLLSGTIMPDHIHLLFEQNDSISIGRIVSKIKGLSFKELKHHNLRWQPNFFEHRLRPDETTGNYARYVFLNPYRERLITIEDTWKHLICHGKWDYSSMLTNGIHPPKEWISCELGDLGLESINIGDRK